MSLIQDVLTLSPVIVVWSGWMFALSVAAPVLLLLFGAPRLDCLVVATAAIALILLMPPWHAHMGYTRLIGLPHIVIWTPLALFLYLRWEHLASPWPVRWTTAALMTTIVVSLGFDYADALRWLLGERAPLI